MRRGRDPSGPALVGWLSDPINSQGVNKQLTAAMGKRGNGRRGREGERGNRFSVPLPLVAAWLGSRGKRRAALGVRREGALERNEKCVYAATFRYRLCEMAEK